ncbi:reverse transcriptase [Trichonephila clavipes]|nr:reverse transcriptase [Trichonephila clavipes]
MAGLWPYNGSQVVLESPAMRKPTKKPSHTQTGNPLDSQKNKGMIISISFDKYTIVTQKTKSLGKASKTLVTVGPIPRHLERAEAIDGFRLTTGHNFMGVYLHWLSLAADETCPLCDHARMYGDILLQCTGLTEYPTDGIVNRYWKARRQMVKNPTTGAE